MPRRILFALIGLLLATLLGSIPANAYEPVNCKAVLAEVHGKHLSVFEAAMIGKNLRIPTSSVYRCVSKAKAKEAS